jgi:hypothetical protein
MRRADTLLVVVVGTFAVFVGWRVVATPRPRHVAANAVAQRASSSKADAGSSSPTTPDASPSIRSSRAASSGRDVTIIQREQIASVPNPEQVRSFIAGAREGFLRDMLAADSGLIVRWPDRREAGLRIWVQSISGVRDWDSRYAQMARDAFADWSGNFPARFDFVLDSATSDIQIVWLDRFAPELGRRVGNTTRSNDKNGWLMSASITVAVHDSAGNTIQPADLAGIVRHEAGHALGLGHSNDPATKMFPVEVTNSITPADRATLHLLYLLSPGSVR